MKVMYHLLEEDIKIFVANPLQTKQTQGKRTDKLDARRIAISHRDGRLMPSVIPHYGYWMLRKAMRKLVSLINDSTKLKQRLSQLFHQKDFTNKKLLKSKTGLEILTLVSKEVVSEDNINEIINIRSIRKKYRITRGEILELKAFQDSLRPMERITFGLN